MIQHNKSLTQFSYILNNGNMVDITDKCPIKLIQTIAISPLYVIVVASQLRF